MCSVQMSLESGSYPELWKCSFIIPVYKSGDASDVHNYRPISESSYMELILTAN